MLPELIITDGTTTVDLLSTNGGFRLLNWRPAIADYKGGGTWIGSSLADGRRLTSKQFTNVVETFELKINGPSQDVVIQDTQELRRLLEKAATYWTTEWQDEPVWIEARAACETNLRYAIIHRGRIPEDDMPFAGTFFSAPGPVGMDDIALIIERGPWLSDQPGTGTCTETSGQQEWYEEYQPTQSADDCDVDQTGGTIALAATVADMGNVGGNSHDAGVRFRSVAIPQGATILHAYVRLRASATIGVATCAIDIYGEDDATPAVFSTVVDFNGRARTTAMADWTVGAWTAQNYYLSPDITTIIQEIVDLDGWASGNNLVIFLEDDSSSAGAYRRFYTWDHGNVGNEPELFVLYNGGGYFGRAGTCDDEVYIANKHNEAQLTDIYYFDISAAVFSANLVNAALPFSLTPPAPMQINDAVYFGIDTAMADSGPFCSLVFDIGTAATYGAGDSGDWEYWNGAAWADLDTAVGVQDNTNAAGAMTGDTWDTTGVGSVHWRQPSDWATTVVNAVTAYWVRVNFTVATGVTGATQQNRAVYTVDWARFEVDDEQVGGDVPALLQVNLRNQSDRADTGTTPLDPQLYANRVIGGLRSVNRGDDFRAYINCSDEQNPPGVSETTGTNTAIVNLVTSPTGRIARYTPAGAEAVASRLTINVTSVYASQYYGVYRVFLRSRQSGGNAGDIGVQFSLYPGPGYVRQFSDEVSFPNTNDYQMLDFGQFTLPGVGILRGAETTELLTFEVLAGSSGAGPTLDMYDLVFIPVDENAGDFVDNRLSAESLLGTIGNAALRERFLDADSVTNPKRIVRSVIKADSTFVTSIWQHITNGEMVLQANADQRWWALAARGYLSGTHTGANNQPILTDSTVDFIASGVRAGQEIRNTTDGSVATITAVTATTVTGTLSGGAEDDWDTNDAYYIYCPNWQAYPEVVHSVQAWDNQRYLSMRGAR